MFEGYKKSVKRKIEAYCKANYAMIEKSQMKLGKGLFNHRCQLNAVQMVKERKAQDVYLCIILNASDFPVVHFINLDENGFYVDNTLGWEYELYDYYIIKSVNKGEYNTVDDLLMETKRSLMKMYSNGLINRLLRVDEFNIGI